MKRIIIEAVAQSDMRPPYDQEAEGGDWFTSSDGDLVVRVIGDTLNRPTVFLFALHELVEATLCTARGITQGTVDAFDLMYQGIDEPGDDRAAPYRREHRQAMLVEHMMAQFLGIDDYGEVR